MRLLVAMAAAGPRRLRAGATGILRCHIPGAPRQAGLSLSQVQPRLSHSQLACLRRQPHVVVVYLPE